MLWFPIISLNKSRRLTPHKSKSGFTGVSNPELQVFAHICLSYTMSGRLSCGTDHLGTSTLCINHVDANNTRGSISMANAGGTRHSTERCEDMLNENKVNEINDMYSTVWYNAVKMRITKNCLSVMLVEDLFILIDYIAKAYVLKVSKISISTISYFDHITYYQWLRARLQYL